MDVYHLYDLNDAYTNFVLRFGIEPNGLLMNQQTYDMAKSMLETSLDKVASNALITFRGIPVFISEQVEGFNMRFII